MTQELLFTFWSQNIWNRR